MTPTFQGTGWEVARDARLVARLAKGARYAVADPRRKSVQLDLPPDAMCGSRVLDINHLLKKQVGALKGKQ